MTEKRTGVLMATFFLFCFASGLAQSKAIDPVARRQIDAGNQAWIDGMKQGDVGMIAATYTADAVDCSAAGACIRGRSAIQEHMKEDMARSGKAESASVASIGCVQQGGFVYEWGQAVANFAGGKKIVARYLTAWRKESDGAWRIFRNLVIAEK
jgi:ketosteroid isomerase-like protein